MGYRHVCALLQLWDALGTVFMVYDRLYNTGVWDSELACALEKLDKRSEDVRSMNEHRPGGLLDRRSRG